MPRISKENRDRFESTLPCDEEVRALAKDYIERAGLDLADFGRRISYSRTSLCAFLNERYEAQAATTYRIRKAILDFIYAHPLTPLTQTNGTLYETENVRTLRKYFRMALEGRHAILLDGSPGTQKTFVLEHLVAELNREEIPKNGHGCRAYYVYCRQGIRPLDLMKRIAEASNSVTAGTIDRIVRNLRFDLQNRPRVLLVLDEAQHLDVACWETLRELIDRPPYLGILAAGAHGLRGFFDAQALDLEQWRSRLHAATSLPGLSADEVKAIAKAELGDRLTDAALNKLLEYSKAEAWMAGELVPGLSKRDTKLRARKHEYYSARRLFRRLADIRAKLDERAVAEGATA